MSQNKVVVPSNKLNNPQSKFWMCMHLQGVIKLIDAAKKAGVKKFVLQTSILTNGKAIGEGLNPIFLVLNAVTGALDKKLEVCIPFPPGF